MYILPYNSVGTFDILVEGTGIGCDDYLVYTTTVRAGETCVDNFSKATHTLTEPEAPIGSNWKVNLELRSSSKISNGGVLWHNWTKAKSTSFQFRKGKPFGKKKWRKTRGYHFIKLSSVFRAGNCGQADDGVDQTTWHKVRSANVKVSSWPSFRFHETGDVVADFGFKTCDGCPEGYHTLSLNFQCN